MSIWAILAIGLSTVVLATGIVSVSVRPDRFFALVNWVKDLFKKRKK